MKNLFVPYELAVTAKEKGFNEPCLAGYSLNSEFCEPDDELNCFRNRNRSGGEISAPLYAQLVDWFREKHKIEIGVFSVLPFKYGYNFEFMDAWKGEKKSVAVSLVDQVLYMEKKGYIPIKTSEFELMNLSYYQALTKAIEEAFKLI